MSHGRHETGLQLVEFLEVRNKDQFLDSKMQGPSDGLMQS